MRRLALVASLALVVGALEANEQIVYRSASVGSRWLSVPGSARVAALAGAFVARGAEPGALEANPASLAGMQGWQAFFTHNAWVEGMSVERLSAAMNMGCRGTYALQIDYLNLGQAQRYDLDALGNPQAMGSLFSSSFALGAAAAWDFGALSLGANLRGLGENVASGNRAGLQMDLGARWNFDSGWRAGLSTRNLGLDFDPGLRPITLRGGAGKTVFYKEQPIALDANIDWQAYDQEPPTLRLAAEWAPLNQLIARAGWIVGNERAPTGPTLGLGYLREWFEIDYAFFGAGDLGFSHLITLRLLPPRSQP